MAEPLAARARMKWPRLLGLAAGLLALAMTLRPARAGSADWSSILDYFEQSAAEARATQPEWSSPLVTTTAMLEQRVRFDLDMQHVGNGADTTFLDGGKGLDLIVSDTSEIQLATAPYELRSSSGSGKVFQKPLEGFGDWAFFRVKQRLLSSPASDGDYVLTTWLQVQAPAGIEALTSNAWTLVPTLGFGKGWGAFDIQGTIGGVLPLTHSATVGEQVQTSVAFQYHALEILWPEVEVNWTWYAGGSRNGLNQVYLTPGLVIGRFLIDSDVKVTLGLGHQFAVAPAYRAKPLTPAYSDAWIFSSRVNF